MEAVSGDARSGDAAVAHEFHTHSRLETSRFRGGVAGLLKTLRGSMITPRKRGKPSQCWTLCHAA